jgi:hypothetical protein
VGQKLRSQVLPLNFQLFYVGPSSLTWHFLFSFGIFLDFVLDMSKKGFCFQEIIVEGSALVLFPIGKQRNGVANSTPTSSSEPHSYSLKFQALAHFQ